MPAVAELAPELIAAVALVAILAVYFLVEALQGIAKAVGMPNWPLVGGALYGAIGHIVTWVGDALGWLWQHANPINMLLASTHWILQQLSNFTGLVVVGIYEAVNRITTVAIPGAINLAEGVARTLYTDATAFATAVGHSVVVYAEGLYHDAVTTIDDAVTVIDATIAGVESRIAGAVAGAVTAATAAALGLVQSLQGWVTQELGALHTTIDGEIQTVTEGIGTQIGDAIHTVEQDLAPGIAAAAAVGAAAAAAFKTWEQDCGDNLCNNLSGYANTIGAILGVISDGALIALIAGAVADPQGTADFITNDIATPAADAFETIAGMLGVKLAA